MRGWRHLRLERGEKRKEGNTKGEGKDEDNDVGRGKKEHEMK